MATAQIPQPLRVEPQSDPTLLFAAVYQKDFRRLRAIAARLLSRERAGHTLQATALVHESFLKLRGIRFQIESEAHLFHLCARAMRQALIDHKRVHGKWVRIQPESLEDLFAALRRSEIDVDLALDLKLVYERLRVIEPAAARVIWLRYFEGRGLEDVTSQLGQSLAHVRTDCAFALKWMADQLNGRS